MTIIDLRLLSVRLSY